MPDYARACRPPDYAPNYAIMPSIMARALQCEGESAPALIFAAPNAKMEGG